MRLPAPLDRALLGDPAAPGLGSEYDPGVATTAPTPGSETALDRLLPVYDVRMLVSQATGADAARVGAAIRSTRLADTRVAVALEAVRHLGRLPQRSKPFSHPDAFEPGAITFVDEPLEVVHGFRGQPWPGGVGVIAQSDPEAVLRGDDPTVLRALLSIRCAPAPYGALVISETRVAWGADAGESFLGYWDFVQFGSALVRRSMLAAIVRQAERPAAA